MAEEKAQKGYAERDRDEPISIPLDPEEALRGLLKTPPEGESPNQSGREQPQTPSQS